MMHPALTTFSQPNSCAMAEAPLSNTMATDDKYDCQLRLWGPSGQKALSSTMVVLIVSSACGTESLKNLVLPGVGAFLVLDDVVYDTDAIVVDEISGEGRDGENNAGGYFGSIDPWTLNRPRCFTPFRLVFTIF